MLRAMMRAGSMAVVTTGIWLALQQPAQAGIGACGDIDVEANAQCEVVPPGVQCEGMCEPLAVKAACTAQLAAECDGGCDDLPSIDCKGECEASCAPTCSKLEPGKFDCVGECRADCGGRCEAQCEANSDRAQCMASCEGSCGASCEGDCDVELPEADCDANCEASCNGSCTADANFDCQIMCQAAGEADCEADVQGGCDIDCKGEEGALFCDGQYIDHGGNLEECIAALRAALDIEVEGSASGEAGCDDDNGCRAEGRAEAQVSSDCTVSRPGHGRPAALVLFGLLWMMVVRGRRRLS